MHIVVDAMGGDHGPRYPVRGAVLAARDGGVPILLVGRAPEIEAELAELDVAGLPIEIVHAPDAIPMGELSPAAAVRTRPESSISVGMTLVRQGRAEAIVTTGHTGAALAGATFRLGRIPGVRRPALAGPFPTLNGPCVLVDIGANTDVRPTNLLQFAVMASAYARCVLDVARPRVGLLSIGEERGKGNQLVQEALPLLEAADLDFVGNVEGGDIPSGIVDVAVMDGFTGNVIIKFAEGMGALVERFLRESTDGDPLGVVGGLMMRPALGRARKRMDYRAYGGAVLLGVRGVVVIGHGRSDAEAFQAAIEVAARGVTNGLVDAIEAGMGSRAEEAGAAGTAPSPLMTSGGDG